MPDLCSARKRWTTESAASPPPTSPGHATFNDLADIDRSSNRVSSSTDNHGAVPTGSPSVPLASTAVAMATRAFVEAPNPASEPLFLDFQHPMPAIDHADDVSPSFLSFMDLLTDGSQASPNNPLATPATAEADKSRAADFAARPTQPLTVSSVAIGPGGLPTSRAAEGASPSSARSSLVLPAGPLSADMQIEQIAPWPAISFFITLYLRYMHSLLPIVHRPSFAQAMTMRADRGDRNLRALVLGLGEHLLDRDVQYPLRQELTSGYFCCQSVGQVNRASALLSEACQVAHNLRLHESGDIPEFQDLDTVEMELRRRVFWHVYAVDITEASGGNMIHLNDFEGLAPLPSSVDDEYITSQGSFPQPLQKPSYMTGYVACVQLFPVMADCIVRHRQLKQRLKRARPLSDAEVMLEKAWVREARVEVDRLMSDLPSALQLGDGSPRPTGDPVEDAVFGMQRANLLITEASVKFSLFDYWLELEPLTTESIYERAALAHRAYATLSSISLDDLASNGESMRGKIFRIVIALLRSPDMGSEWVNTVQDWWSLFSRVNFVQLMPPDMASAFDSRQQSPSPSQAA
ncbi:hypothetical protein EHS25_002879 [Saitozyma podzolica]|uniref:Xylanolytic transcriptional activator regulatory domain-containing protein n=1 Tax=Saitozyma podzolica TaxID=1890683 RepID=A0A427YC46_9TREE|nr:hypothetical protein EHS25_002879 [Saitozyma podzolica]